MSKVICLGEIVIDWIRSAPQGGEASDFAFHPAGVPANVAVALRRLGARSAMIARVGDDELGRRARLALEQEGVDTSAVYFSTAATRAVQVEVLPDGKRRGLALVTENCADRLLARDDVNAAQALFAGADALYFSSTALSSEGLRAAASQAVALAKSNNMLVVSDANIWPAMWADAGEENCRETILAALADIDILKVNLDELEFLTGSRDVDAARQLLSRGPTLVVVTLAADGAYAATASLAFSLPTRQVQVKDVGGAGDAFVASLLADLLATRRGGKLDLSAANLQTLIDRANAAGALTASRFGALPAMPAPAEISQLQMENRL